MLGDISRAEKIYLACGYSDMRKAINGLAAIVQQNFQLDSFSNSLFLFCGRKCNRLKALYWEGDDLSCSINAWRMADFNGRTHRKKSDRSLDRNSAGFWKDYLPTAKTQKCPVGVSISTRNGSEILDTALESAADVMTLGLLTYSDPYKAKQLKLLRSKHWKAALIGDGAGFMIASAALNGFKGAGGAKGGKYSAFGEMAEADGIRYRDWNYEKLENYLLKIQIQIQ